MSILGKIISEVKIQDKQLFSSEEPLLRFERISNSVGLKKWFLYPIPLITLYFFICVAPHLYSLYVDVWWKIYYDDFTNTVGWLVLIVAVSYGTVIFRRKFVLEINKLFREKIIVSKLECSAQQKNLHEIYEKQIRSLLDLKSLVVFLFAFELMVGFF